MSRAKAEVVGISSCNSSSHFDATSNVNVVVPVRLPPGRFRRATSPSSTGSPATKNTIGMAAVASFTANTEGVVIATSTATWRRTRSVANADSRSLWPSAQRYSITKF